MVKKLAPTEGGMAVVIDLPLLAIIGAEQDTELDLSTDGRRLILSPIRKDEVGSPSHGPPLSPDHSASDEVDFADPKVTLKLIRELQKFGLTPELFREIHHFGPKASLANHINYCRGTARFHAMTNVIVAKRLCFCLDARRALRSWRYAIDNARVQFPIR